MKYSLIVFLLIAFSANAKTWQVGPTRQYTAPSKVMTLVADGDTVLIDSGLYVGDVGAWTNNNLVIRCPNGMARFNANGNIAQKKGIWVLAGNNTYVEGFEFYGAAIDSAHGDNGAGIRVGGNGLTCRRCYFHDNQEGILTANDTTNNNIFIEACEFDHNGVVTGTLAGYEHNIYVGHSTSCTIKFCYFHRAIVGHEIKSRANVNYILYNYIVDDTDGDGSYSIDLPNGGESYIIGNAIEKGPKTQNPTAITYGEEGLINPDSQLYFVNNTTVTDRSPTTFFEIQPGTKTALIANNIFAGPGHPLTATDTIANVESTDTSFFHFADVMNYGYNLTANFPGLETAVNEGNAHGFSLTPINEYVDPMDSISRQFLNEVGAFSKIFGNLTSDSIAIIDSFPETVCMGDIDTEKITVTNTGTDSNSYLASISGSLADFRIIGPNPSSVIPPGGVATFIVTFSPGSIGTAFATFNITGGPGSSFPLRAKVGNASITGSGTAPPTEVGTTCAPFALTLCNTGTCPWTPGFPAVTPPFIYVSGGTEPIPPGGCETLIFTFSPNSSGTFTQTVNFPNAGGFSIPAPDVIITGTATSSGVSQDATNDTNTIEQNYPNPFSSETIIPLPPNTFGSLELFDVCGNKVDVKYEQIENGLIIERGNLPEGIYFYRIMQAERGTIVEGSVVIGN